MPRGRPQKYPWVNWLDGERYVLNSAAHFPGVDVRSFRQQALNEAAKRGVAIATRIRVNPSGDGVDYIELKRRPAMKTKRIDWDKVFANLPRTFFHGKDFDCRVESFRIRVHQAAQRRGPLPVRIEVRGTEVSVYPVRDKPVTEMAPAEEAVR